MKLKILSPEKTVYKAEAKSFNVKTLAGEITILSGHEPLISMFDAGTAHIIDGEDKKVSLEIGKGFLEMTPENELNVLTEQDAT